MHKKLITLTAISMLTLSACSSTADRRYTGAKYRRSQLHFLHQIPASWAQMG
ncbi:hypothetical protein [Paenibacillus ferrarius]|uniref:hypothetical protein n=1 Tax=Paenibacillus ferrarius TaxID=1469647 RepID=UPI003D280D9E